MSALRGFGLGRLAALAGIGVGLAAALVALTLSIGSQPKALLYSNLDLKEASAVVQALEQAGIKYEAKGDGSTIMVPRDQVAETRLMIASKGLVSSGSVGYEIFDQGATLGQTDFVQQLNRQRALEGELARTIRGLDGVTSVRVHLNLPRRQLFEEAAEAPSASVTIGIGGRKPSDEQVQAVQNLVAGAVPGLKAEQVAVIDQHGKTLSAAGGSSMAGKMADDRRSEVERRLAARIKEMVEGVVGPGRARVEVTADIDMARITEQRETFDPDGQVVRSEQTGEETARENEPGSADAVSATANIPGGGAGAADGLTSSNSGRQESTTNYEISKTVTTEVREPGTVKKMSVAVAVDGITAVGKDGKPGAYSARSAAEMARLEELVKAAVGFDAERGDTVRVTNVRFAREALDEAGVTAKTGLLSGFDKNDIMRAIELGVLAILGILMMLFGVRPLLRGLTGGGSGGGMLPALSGAAGGVTTRLVATPDGGTMQIAVDPHTGEPLALPGPDMDQRIDIARIEGQVRASSVKRVSDFVDKHPDESVSILRSWLHETA
ncbi:MAG: flagellar basal-body MS-ring/collar protein FliF [Caulobacter sp.]|nr:flagellar basal-body MS-ring/collar protein FliF [Caulobacter sp.]